MPDIVVVIGAGQAGGSCAQALRAHGFAGRILLIGAEEHPPYERPPLSKDVLAGVIEPEATYMRPAAWYGENDIELRVGTAVVAIDRDARTLLCDDGERIAYDSLVLATGSRSRPLVLAGGDVSGVLGLRSIADVAALRAKTSAAKRVAIIGAGLIGLEVAATLRAAGADITVIEAASRAMGRVVPPLISDYFARLHADRGVTLITGCTIAALAPSEHGTSIRLDDGRVIDADLVLAGIGSVPETALAEAAGLGVADGILVDGFGRTDDPAIWATGDCCRFPCGDGARTLRLESWNHAQSHGTLVARNICGASEAYDETPWMWSDQFGVNLQVAGDWHRAGDLVERSVGDGRLIASLDEAGRVVAAATIDAGRAMRPLRNLIKEGRPVAAVRLADPTIDLREL